MAVVKFLTQTKYHKKFYPPHQNVEVEDKDLDELVSLGAIIVSKNEKPAEEVKASAKAVKEDAKGEVKAEKEPEKKATKTAEKKTATKAADKKSK